MAQVTASRPSRLFEQTLVLMFLLAPPIGGLVVLYQALQDPPKFWMTIGCLAGIIALAALHIKFVRPYFRRFPWMISLKELRERGRRAAKRHPKLVAACWRSRMLRYLYRFVATALFAVPLVGLYLLHKHHFLWFMGGWMVAGFGITIGYHRVGTHPSFKTSPFMRGVWLTMGSMAMQGPAGEWLKKHSKHHAFGETTADPHSPHIFDETKQGMFKEQLWSFMHSFVMWAMREPSLTKPRKMTVEQWEQHLLANPPKMETFRYREEDRYFWEARDKDGNIVMTTEQLVQKRWNKLVETLVRIEKDPVVKFVSNPIFYVGCLVVTIMVPYWLGGISVWESLARICYLNWVTFCVNSVCHIWGESPFKTPDNSKNNAVIEVLALGEGGHNTHHKSELWAQHGIFAWQFDPSAWVIKGMAKIGLAWDVNLPTRGQVVQSWRQWRKRQPWMQGFPARDRVPIAEVAEAA